MGRAKRDVPTGKLILKYPKTGYDKSKEYTLYYYYSFNRKTMTKDTGYRVKVKDWNPDGNSGKGALLEIAKLITEDKATLCSTTDNTQMDELKAKLQASGLLEGNLL